MMRRKLLRTFRNSYLAVLLILASNALAQNLTPVPGTGQIHEAIQVQKAFMLPGDTVKSTAKNADTCRQLAIKNGNLYRYNCSLGHWVKIVSGSSLDSVRRSNDTLYFRTASGEIAVKMEGIEIAGINGLADSLIRKLSGKIVQTVDQLPAYPTTDSLIFVADTVRGGLFASQAAGSADGGVVFDASDGGYWRRVYDPAGGINVRWYGPAADSLTDDIAKIQAAINRAAADSVGLVTMRGMNILIDSAIRLPSNMTLDATGSYIQVKKYSNEYLVRNADFVNGNTNKEVFGGRWNGNGLTQTVSAGTDIESARACAGFFFYRSSKLRIHDLEVDSTKAWGVSGINCDQIHVYNVHFEQNPFDASGNPAVGINGDGVTFNAGNALIENITGFTNDDMVAFGCGGPTIASTPLPPVDLRDYENITIRDIFPSSRQGVTTHRGVGLYSRNGYKLSNITIDGINGNTSAGAVVMSDPNGVGANFRNVKINNINGSSVFIPTSPSTYNGFGIIGFNAIQFIDNISISNVNRYDTYSSPADMIKTQDSSIIGNMNLSNISVKANGARITFINDGGTIRNINLSNVMLLDSAGLFPQGLYTRSASNFGGDTVRISGYAVNVTQDNSYVPIAKGGKKIWLNLPTVILDDTTDLVRRDGATVYTRSTGLNTFQNNRWYGHSMLNQNAVDQSFTGRITGPLYSSGGMGIGVTSLTSTFQVTGSMAINHRVITGNTTAGAEVVLYANNTGTATISLPAASSCPGRVYIIKKISANGNDVVIDPNASESIDGQPTKTITLQYSAVAFHSSGANWFSIGAYATSMTL
ncbi:hypothetical protein ACFOTA_06930 [Chitinophaga sp. GCM10012297]|uniref:Uncharacterized protein n=1 Tax=Chitinophaga chungangae TaxID=2821488 RepID=A0ABS3YB81_9BACT|nr:hypothetical protein [Chitinophaga chungangae]MBO9151933.1 hypothetical protein [Chitinophaga chungangae]